MEESIACSTFSRYNQAGCISKLFFTWILKDLWSGFRGQLKKDDVHIQKHLLADYVGEHLNISWQNEVDKGKSNLKKVIFKAIGFNALLASSLNFGKYCLGTLTQIYCLGLFVDTFDPNHSSDFLFHRYLAGSVIIVVTLAIVFLLPHSYFIAEVTGIKLSVGCSSLVFQKILKVSVAEMTRLNVGHLLTVIANDVAKFDYMCRASLTRLFDPLIISAYIVFLTLIIGKAALAAVAVIVVFLFINMFVGKLFKKIRKQRAWATDQRLKFTAEMIAEVKAVKMLSWEDAYHKVINQFRKLESKYLFRNCLLRTVGAVQSMISSQTAFFTVLVVLVLTGDEITPKKVFTSFAGFASLRVVVVILLGRAFEQTACALVSIQRIQKLMLIRQIKLKSEQIDSINSRDTILKFESSWFQTMKSDINLLLVNHFRLKIATAIPKGSMTVIAGPVGSGKTSLLLTMADELCILKGHVQLSGTIAYLPQQPWLFSATVKQNILFGLPFDLARYLKVISACTIDKDLATMEKGDSTIVDDKGLTLSGGQKARICLARCLYRNCDMYLLDDPLSAVDVKVEGHIYTNCFKNRADKTIVLVSHRLRNLSDDVNFIYLEKGQITSNGLYKDVKSKISSSIEKKNPTDNVDSVPANVFEEVSLTSSTSDDYVQVNVPEVGKEKLLSFKHNSYIIYFRRAIDCCYGLSAILLIFGFGIVAQTCSSYFDISVAIWTNEVYDDESNGKAVKAKRLYYLGCILIAEIVLFTIGYGMFYLLCLKASNSLHQRMLQRVLKADMSFFDTNQTGKILNKFSKDLENLDDFLPQLLVEGSRCGWNCLGLLVNVAYSNYLAIGPMVICLLLCILIAKMYSKSIKIIKKAEAETRSPIYTYMNSSMLGLAVIRSHDNQQRIGSEFNWHQDQHTAVWFLMRAFVDWIALATEFIATILTISFIVIVFVMPESMTGSKIGLGISSMLLFGDLLEHCINQFIEADNQIISAKRIHEYSQLPLEDKNSVRNELRKNWPESGNLNFTNVTLHYGTKAVLKTVNFNINPGEKIGIVGRTGAGKSSLITALFRMAPFSGSITIDGVDISTLSITEYRKKLSVIPQHPVILAGTIRYNLDPSNEHSDDELWKVLENVHLKDSIQKIGLGLETGIDHLSVGQKQLCCLARVILRNNKIVILDEATSNIDNTIDAELQQIIKQRFRNSTMLIIAHRLETIMDTDKVMVLHNGEIIEFDTPSILLQNHNSVFRRMVSQTAIQNSQ